MDRIVVVTVEELEVLVERAVRRVIGEKPAPEHRSRVATLSPPPPVPPQGPEARSDGHVGIVALEKRLGRGRTTIRDWYTAKKFPAPHYCGAFRCWFLHEVEAWEAQRAGKKR